MKPSEIYLKAAKLADSTPNGLYPRDLASCWAIAFAEDPKATDCNISEYAREFASLFRPDADERFSSCWLVESGEVTYEERQPWRVLALLFMHQIAKDEERK